MDPFSIVGSTQSIGRRFSFYIAVQVVSVLAPGIVIIIGIFFLVELFQHRQLSNSAQSLLKGVSGATGLLVALFVLAAGYVAGYVIRELAFNLLTEIERLPRFRDELQVNAYKRVESFFPAQLINDCFEAHPLLRAARKKESGDDKTSQNNRATSSRDSIDWESQLAKAGGGHIENSNYRSFEYAKLWIRNFAPGFSIDNVEAEINILASGLAPGLLTGLVILAAAHLTWWSVCIAISVVALIWTVLLGSLLRLRRTEAYEAIRNLILDYTMRQAINAYPSTQNTPNDKAG